jgi:hypothetical protein
MAEVSAVEAAVRASPLYAKYNEVVDRDSARERLATRIEEGAAKAAEDAKAKEAAREQKAERVTKQAKKDDDGIVMDVVRSSAFKDFMRTAAREVARGMFKSGRR